LIFILGHKFTPKAVKGDRKYGTAGGCTKDLLSDLQLPDDVAQSLAEFGNLGVAKSTWSSYKSAKQMLMKCEKDTRNKMELPLRERDILIFIDYLARHRNLRGNTINCYLSGLRQLHVIAGITPPVIRSGLVKLVLKGLTNRDNIASKTAHLSGRLPMTSNVMLLLKKLIPTLNLSDVDKALIWAVATVAFAGAFRISEILCRTESTFDPDFDLLEKDVSFSTDRQGKTTAHFTLKCPKESKDSKVTTVDLFQNDGPLCPIAAIKHWTNRIVHKRNLPFFCFDDGTPLTGAKMNLLLDKTLGLYTDKSIGKFTTHSFRIGLATELGRLGYSDDQIKAAGRWSSRVFEAYIRLKRAKRSVVAKEISKMTAGKTHK